MSDEAGERSFDATPSRVEKARREGDTARSQEFGANAAFICAAIAAVAVAPVLGACARAAIIAAAHGEIAVTLLGATVACAFVPVAAGMIGGFGASVAQTGGLVVIPVRADFAKLSPANGFKRMLSRETISHGVRALVAFSVAAAVLASTLRDAFAAASFLATPALVASLAWSGAKRAAFTAAAIGLAFSIAEYGVARKAWLSKLKMSLREIKRDFKESEGDPQMRARRKAFHRNLVRGSIARVKDAAFIVVNPTHVAVALEYHPPDICVPMVVVRASDEGALRVREEAMAHAVPIVENAPLARALFATCSVGDAIPHDHYVAVAEVVAALTRQGVLG